MLQTIPRKNRQSKSLGLSIVDTSEIVVVSRKFLEAITSANQSIF